MTRLVKVLGVVVLIAGAAVAYATNVKPEVYTWRYKMTVSVDTPEGIKTGSAVREVAVKIEPFPLNKRKPWRSVATVKGEAIVVDLGQRGKLFSLLDGDDAYRIVFTTFPYHEGGLTPEGAAYYSKLKAGPQKVERIPIMVAFKDVKDPKSIELAYQYQSVTVTNQIADNYKITDNLEKLFGTSVKLKGVSLEMTEEPITLKISEYLPSFDNETGFWEWKQHLKYEDYRYHIGPNSFH